MKEVEGVFADDGIFLNWNLLAVYEFLIGCQSAFPPFQKVAIQY
jgi:hypothetical protein